MEIGASYTQGLCRFAVWAPLMDKVSLELPALNQSIPMVRDHAGYHRATLEDCSAGTPYSYRHGDKNYPDPASNSQPEGVHGPSAVVDHSAFEWHDQKWTPPPLEKYIIYEIHVGTFTEQGTFDAVVKRLDDLIDLGITAIEIMPVAQFPGSRNWGYDGAYPFAVQNSYGGPEGLKRLIDACHRKNLAVILDVVYNHFGPEGAYIGLFGPYFTDKYKTPWGKAINFDDAQSDEVRNFFIQNALGWFGNYHFDALRLDAVHAIYDFSATPFLQELSQAIEQYAHQLGRKFSLIAESDLNDIRIINPPAKGGFGLDAQWCDDFHHSLHTLLTGESQGYYDGFGTIDDMAKSLRQGFVYSWDWAKPRQRHFGSHSETVPSKTFVVFSQNHDQVGNRMLGERLTALVDFEALKLTAAAVLLSPYIPLIFMGEEYGEECPFLYFVDHSDPDLIHAVRQGRIQEFADFGWESEPPDPQSPDTFSKSVLCWPRRQSGSHKMLLSYYKQLIMLRNSIPALALLDSGSMEVTADEQNEIIAVKRWCCATCILLLLNFKQQNTSFRTDVAGFWKKLLDSADVAWGGPGSQAPESFENPADLILKPCSAVLYQLEKP